MTKSHFGHMLFAELDLSKYKDLYHMHTFQETDLGLHFNSSKIFFSNTYPISKRTNISIRNTTVNLRAPQHLCSKNARKTVYNQSSR